ncbi:MULTISPECIES: alkylmercury lyase family protein [Amycolatopsis]|uniref:alkylmercury lyase family protein n=1 Tax=Amycolatopsis TaxID=1813 RepID=UPI0033A90EA5
MELQILQVPDCPNAALLRQRLAEAIGPDVVVTARMITDLTEATSAGMSGSPTLLVNGVDPFAAPGSPASVSCRLYRDAEGRVSGAPTVTALRQALHGQHAQVARARARALAADPAERAVHGAILRSFTTDGTAPGARALEQAVAPFEIPVDEVLGRLHERDVIRLTSTGDIRAAYPFSAVPTRHRVHLADGPTVYAICMIDALGMPAMLDTDATITTTPPGNAGPITVTVTAGQTTWNPAQAVVFVGAEAAAGPSAEVCGDHLNAFADAAAAQAWAVAHPEVPGDILDGATAAQLGSRIFGDLLAPESGQSAAPATPGGTHEHIASSTGTSESP